MREKIKIRRDKVSQLLIQNHSETKIAAMLGVARQTVVRDVAYLKRASRNWVDGSSKDGFIFEYKLALDKIKDREFELQKLYKQSTEIGQKLQILKALNDNTKLYLELLSEHCTIHAIRRARNVQTP